MSSKTPTIKQTAWISLLPQLSFMGLLMFCYYKLGSSDPYIQGTLSYLVLSFLLRTFIPNEHRRGMKLVQAQRFAEAITLFEKSYAFFSKNPWIDKYRFLTLLSSSAMSYREMALCNIAFCYTQIGDGKTAIQWYTRALQEFPLSGLAHAALRMLHSAEGLKQDG